MGDGLVVDRTGDGSDTVLNSETGQHYHSTFGAIEESELVFIRNGLRFFMEHCTDVLSDDGCIHILEAGFGTGLNALLTQAEAEKYHSHVQYTSVELFPLPAEIWQKLNYPVSAGSADDPGIFEKIHNSPWGESVRISPHFTLEKLQADFLYFTPGQEQYHIIFFDAFSPDFQPELWTTEIFTKLYDSMVPGGIFVTYSVKGTIVRAMKAAGFTTEKLPGPSGKRHVLRAVKNPT